jgi:hypothetical protein
MSDLQVVGPQFGSTGAPKPFNCGSTGAQRVGDAHGRYLQAVMENRAFSVSVAAAAPTAYVGAAGGTPLLGIFNPPNSGKVLAILMATIAMRAAATAAGQAGLAIWSGPTATPTMASIPTNQLSGAKSGSSASASINAANTSSTALALAAALATYYWATAAGAFMAPGLFDIAGIVVVPPGAMAALGLTVVPTSVTADASLIWEELPYQPLG